jgi:hypothetical protein
MEALIRDQTSMRELRGDVGVYSSTSTLPVLIDVTVSAIMAPSYLAASKSRLYKRAAKDEELGIGVQLKAQEARKIRHYAHYLKADARVPELASAWSHGDVFERLGVSFVPVAMSIFGNRGEALEKFISSVAKISPSFSSKYFFDPVESFFVRQQHISRTKEFYRALLAVGFIRGLYSAQLHRNPKRFFPQSDSDNSHAPFTFPHPPV